MNPTRAPQFLLLPGSRFPFWRDVICVFSTPGPPVIPLGLYHRRNCQRDKARVSAFFASALLHLAVIFFYYRIPYELFFRNALGPDQTAHRVYDVHLVYNLETLKVSEYFPVIQPPGPGGTPGHDTVTTKPPIRGSDAAGSRVTIISAPPNPDNYRQRIEQSALPPEMKIPVDVPLPNVIAGVIVSPPEAPKLLPPEPWHPSIPRIEIQAATSAGVVVPEAPHLTLSSEGAPLPSSELPLPAPPPADMGILSESQAFQRGVAEAAVATTGMDLLSLSVQPVPASISVTVPAGSRQGEFSISEVAGRQGSPGGIPAKDLRSGVEVSVSSGDRSIGVGAGTSGGGGVDVDQTVPGSIAIASTVENTGNADKGQLPSFFATSLVFPVRSRMRPRPPAIVITSGPRGGGGLPVYGVLHGRKVYSIYLPMPGKSWILEYCDAERRSQPQASQARAWEVRLDPGLTPPSVEESYDFHRPPLPREKAAEMIILYGMITENGSVTDLKVIRSLQKIADQAALIAFGRWKFKPAFRSGKPVVVEILVGIPAIVTETQELSAAN
ncbi:MAG TPA: energy transducer TonB [Terriglobia bacterium]|nr:energy transducer TonB [Terriglobia bacterium]